MFSFRDNLLIKFNKGCNVTGVTVNRGKIPEGEGLSFNYHGNRRGDNLGMENSRRMCSVQHTLVM